MTTSHSADVLQAQRTARLTRIRRVSRFMKWFVTCVLLLLVAVGLLLSALLVFPGPFEAMNEMMDLGEVERRLGDVPLVQRAGVSALVVISFGILVGICWQIRQLFEFLRQGDYFSPRTLFRFVGIGGWLIAFGLLDVLTDPLMTLLFTLDLPEGQRQLDLTIDGGELFFIVIGSLMIVFGWTLREAAEIADENRQFI
ncbi:conserved hypothetical protein [Roseibium sp. TrichSKD4]|uniref:DUF2975 domain-containing protein n=1 Tax=Roseibium sp. TrichSKD4 TaxID=744980 RepID=UPI0001E571CF|nr:DUF2975 domain-containing protein [Roseibium sp. TrichSKD4]EFO29016.1 conserved hypothetical protein [Roseibium sp. TrichSKD4]